MELTKEEIQELNEASGFIKTNFTRYPYLKFISSSGGKSKVKTFCLLTSKENGGLDVEELGESVNVIFLSKGKFRLKKGSYITNDLTPRKDKNVDVYKVNRETGKRNFLESGEWRTIKDKYGLSTFQYPYVLLDNKGSFEIVKLGILPSSLSNYWEYSDSFKEGELIYGYQTILKASEEPKISSEGGDYYQIDFSRGEKVKDINFIKEKVFEVKSSLDKKELAKKEYDPFEMDGINEGILKETTAETEERELPVIDTDEEIDIKDIPF